MVNRYIFYYYVLLVSGVEISRLETPSSDTEAKAETQLGNLFFHTKVL